MGIGIKLKYFGIIFKSKLNKFLQKRFVYIPETQQNVLIKSFSELYAAEYVNEVAISINTNLAKEKEVLKLVIKRLILQNKRVILIEEVRAFDDNDLKEFAELGRDIHIDQRYMEPSKAVAQNQVLYTDMTSYKLIMEKLDFFEAMCNKYCNTEFEKVLFVTTEQSADEIQTMLLAYVSGVQENKILMVNTPRDYYVNLYSFGKNAFKN